jgi:lipoprotein-releasing system permease protein
MSYELFIALRYLRAKRRQTAVSVITAIAILGITTGVAALLVALALIKGFRSEIQDKILQGTAHLNLLKADGSNIENYEEIVAKVRTVPGVIAASATGYEPVLLTIGVRSEQAIVKGVDLAAPSSANEIFSVTIEGDHKQLGPSPIRQSSTNNSSTAASAEESLEGILVGQELARALGLQLNSVVTLVSATSRLTPAGLLPRPRYTNFKVVGFFASGLFEYDSKWAYISLSAFQKLSGQGSTAGVIQMRVNDIYAVDEIGARVRQVMGKEFVTNNWQELNRPLFIALQLQQRVVVIFFTLLIAIAALNIVTTLSLMVVEKHRDIAILRAQGASPLAIARIFCWQGTFIGVIGTVAGLVLGIFLNWLINTYRFVSVPAEIYSISFITLKLRLGDIIIVCFSTLLISFLATLYPAYSAAKLQPVEVLRYE